jgi:NAD(P)-dependent dehydrogenase (short-subunit alcohol dehydrogenase family)
MGERMKGRVCLVIGAGSSGPGWGNGKAAAALYAREGGKVFCVDLRAEAAEETAEIIRGEGGEATAHAADVSDPGAVEALTARCLESYGRIDVLHNNVGILETRPIAELPVEAWDKVMDVNLKSFFLTCKAALPVMAEQGRGAIVNISSVAAIRYTGVDYITYYTTKGAIVPFTRGIALEYAKKGVRANCVLPGLMNTPMIVEPLKGIYGAGDIEKMIEVRDAQCPTGKMGDAWDVAHASLFLASDEAKYVTGTELIVDGGLSAKFS